MKPIILSKHINGNDTIVYRNHVLNGLLFWDMSNEELTNQILKENNITSNQWQKVLDAVEKGKGNTNSSNSLKYFAYNYCRTVEIDSVMRQVVLDAGDPNTAIDYCLHIENDKDMRQVILDSGDPEYAVVFGEIVSNHEDMRQMVFVANNPELALRWCLNVSNSNKMRQIIIDTQDAESALTYCEEISDDEDMRQVADLYPIEL